MKISENILLKEKPVRVLILLNKKNQSWYLAKLAKQAEVSYVFITELINQFETYKLINIKNIGKKKKITISKKGSEIAMLLKKAIETMKNDEQA